MKELEKIEFKKSPGEWKEIVETVCAFANTEGGKIYIGVSNSGKILGTNIGKSTIEDLTNKIVNNTEPKVYPKISTEKIENKDVIVIDVAKSVDQLVLTFGRPFNPLIAKAFFWIKYIEEVGTGTNKIIDWYTEWGLPEPDFEFTGTSMVVILRKSKLTEEYLATLGLTEQEKKIIEYIKINKRITSGEIQNLFDVTRMTANRYIKKLIELSIVERKGKGKDVYYVFKTK